MSRWNEHTVKPAQVPDMDSSERAALNLGQLRVKPDRIAAMIEELGRIGLGPGGGLDRTAFTAAELEARNWLMDRLRRLGLQVRVDAAANIWGRRVGGCEKLPAVAFGSHLDTVPNGGRYDGALGVLLAVEVMTVLEEAGVQNRRPLELVSFSAEEPNPYGLSTFGSRVAAGKLSVLDVERSINEQGERLVDALARAGGCPTDLALAHRGKDELAAFLEVHIEQGKRLLKQNVAIGVVTAITGIFRVEITVRGEANHAGTTLMADRKDALMAAAEMLTAFESICAEHALQEVVGTIGRIHCLPNAPNIIPGEVRFHLEIRGSTAGDIQHVYEEWRRRVDAIVARRGVTRELRLLLDQAPVAMDERLAALCDSQADELGYLHMRLTSMAGHDAAHMAALAPTCMLFVPSLDGKSHCPEEESRIEDIEKAGNVLLRSVLALAMETGGGGSFHVASRTME